MPVTYEAQQYWDNVLGHSLDERGVAYPWLPLSFNRAIYRALLQSTKKVLADNHIDIPTRVLDIGSGTGIWVDYWHNSGAREIVGLDLTEAAVLGLKRRYPYGTFLQADVGADVVPVTGPFDVVSAMSVLLHITDDARWQQAWNNIATVLKPGGHAILIEPVVAHQWWGEAFDEISNSKARTLAAYEDAIRFAGLELLGLRPATVLLANPIDTRSRRTFRLLTLAWEMMSATIRGSETRGRVVGGLLGRLDPPLRRLLPFGPSAKLLLVRRAQSGNRPH